MAFLAALLIVPGGLAAPAAADPNVPETVTVFHESFAGGQGVAVQSGSPSIMHVTGKVFDGNADGHALYLSGRTNTWDALDYEFEKIGLFDGKTYTVTVIGYVDADETVPAGAKAYLQTANSYGLWGEADFEPGKAFTLTGTVTADYSKDDRLRIQSNGYGESVSFYIGEVIITTDNPIYESLLTNRISAKRSLSSRATRNSNWCRVSCLTAIPTAMLCPSRIVYTITMEWIFPSRLFT